MSARARTGSESSPYEECRRRSGRRGRRGSRFAFSSSRRAARARSLLLRACSAGLALCRGAAGGAGARGNGARGGRRPAGRRHHPGDHGGGQPAHRGRHHPLLHAGAARRPVRSRPAGPQPEDPLRHRPVPGRAGSTARATRWWCSGGEPAGQPGRLRGQPRARPTTSFARRCSSSRAPCTPRRWPRPTASKILDLYAAEGLLRRRVVPQIIRLPQNRVDVVFRSTTAPRR